MSEPHRNHRKCLTGTIFRYFSCFWKVDDGAQLSPASTRLLHPADNTSMHSEINLSTDMLKKHAKSFKILALPVFNCTQANSSKFNENHRKINGFHCLLHTDLLELEIRGWGWKSETFITFVNDFNYQFYHRTKIDPVESIIFVRIFKIFPLRESLGFPLRP